MCIFFVKKLFYKKGMVNYYQLNKILNRKDLPWRSEGLISHKTATTQEEGLSNEWKLIQQGRKKNKVSIFQFIYNSP